MFFVLFFEFLHEVVFQLVVIILDISKNFFRRDDFRAPKIREFKLALGQKFYDFFIALGLNCLVIHEPRVESRCIA